MELSRVFTYPISSLPTSSLAKQRNCNYHKLMVMLQAFRQTRAWKNNISAFRCMLFVFSQHEAKKRIWRYRKFAFVHIVWFILCYSVLFYKRRKDKKISLGQAEHLLNTMYLLLKQWQCRCSSSQVSHRIILHNDRSLISYSRQNSVALNVVLIHFSLILEELNYYPGRKRRFCIIVHTILYYC